MGISDKLAFLKNRDNITTEELSIRSGVPIGTINKVLTGETKNPTAKTSTKLAKVFGETAEYLLNDDIPIIHSNKHTINDQPIKLEISRNLTRYRKLNNLTQAELADLLGVKHNTISSWENGTNSIDIEMLAKICNILNVSINDMYGKYGDKKNSPSPSVEGSGEQELPPNIANQKDAYLVRIKAAMEARGVDAAYLARELNISTDDMAAVLESDHNPPRPLLYPLARILKVKVTYLMGYPVKMDRVYYSEDGERLSESDIDWIDFVRLCQDEQAKRNALTAASAFLTTE